MLLAISPFLGSFSSSSPSEMYSIFTVMPSKTERVSHDSEEPFLAFVKGPFDLPFVGYTDAAAETKMVKVVAFRGCFKC